MTLLRGALAAGALTLIACSTGPVVALSSDVGPNLDSTVQDVGVRDTGLDAGSADFGFPDAQFADAGRPDAELSDGPVGCVYPEVEQVGPAEVDELLHPNSGGSSVVGATADGTRFVVAWEFGPGPRSDEPFPVLRYYPKRGAFFMEENLYSLTPSDGVFDVRENEPGSYGALAKAGPPGGLQWSILGGAFQIQAGAGHSFGPAVFQGSKLYAPIHPSAVGASGHFESLSLAQVELNTAATTSVAVDDSVLSLGFDDPRVVGDDTGDVWLTTIQQWDFPPTVVATRLDPATGLARERISASSCGRVQGYDLLSYNGNVGLLTDCAASPGTAATRMTLGQGSFRADQVILEGTAVAVPSRLAYHGGGLAVAYWEEGQRTPALRFYSSSGTPLSAGAIRLPVPPGLDANALPLSLALRGIPGASGGFSVNTAAWGLVYAYQSATTTVVQSYFARLGPCGTALAR